MCIDRETLAEALWNRYWSHDLASVPPDFKYAGPLAQTKFLCDADALLPVIEAHQ